MDFFETIAQRSSIRKYKSEMPSDEAIKKVIEAARIAPSACNKQPWHFYVIKSPEVRRQITAAYDREWIKSAPAIIIATGNHTESWHRAGDGKDHLDVDVAIAGEHIALAAQALGLATCWVCNFDTKLVSDALKLGKDDEPIALFPLGFPDVERKDVGRKSLDEILTII